MYLGSSDEGGGRSWGKWKLLQSQNWHSVRTVNGREYICQTRLMCISDIYQDY